MYRTTLTVRFTLCAAVLLAFLLPASAQDRSREADAPDWVVAEGPQVGLPLSSVPAGSLVRTSSGVSLVLAPGAAPVRLLAWRGLSGWTQRLSETLMHLAANSPDRKSRATAALEAGRLAAEADLTTGVLGLSDSAGREVFGEIQQAQLLLADGSDVAAVEAAQHVRHALTIGFAVSPRAHAPLLVSPTQLDFGSLCVGDTKSLPVIVVNTSGTLAQTINAGPAPGNGFSVLGTFPIVLPPGGAATVTVQFAPSAVQSYTGTLALTSSAGDAPTVAMDGSGAEFSVQANSLDFGKVLIGKSKQLTFDVKNCSNAALSVQFKDGKAPPFVLAVPLPTEVGGGKTETVTVDFSPTAVGPATRTIVVVGHYTSKDKKQKQKVVLQGEGVEPLGFDKTSMDFGHVPHGMASSRSVTLTNNTSAALTVNVDYSDLDQTFFHPQSTSPITLQPGQSQTFTIYFEANSKCSHHGKVKFTGDGLPADGETLKVDAIAD